MYWLVSSLYALAFGLDEPRMCPGLDDEYKGRLDMHSLGSAPCRS